MSFTNKLSEAIGGFGDSLWGSGAESRAKGELIRSRIGSNDAMAGNRLAQTRDLDYAHNNKKRLLERLMGNDRMYNAGLSGDFSDYVPSSIADENQVQKMQALKNMAADPNTAGLAQALNAGMKGHDFANMNRIDLLAPEEVNKLQAETGDIANRFGLADSLNNANIGLIKQQQNTNSALMSKRQQETANLMNKGLMDEQTGILNLQKIEAEMGYDAAESAQRINTLKSSQSEFNKNFQLAQEKLTQLQKKGQNLDTAMTNMAKIKVEGDVTLADFAAVGGLKEAASKILGGSQVGGTAAFQVIDKIHTRLQGDKDTEYLVDDGKGGQESLPYTEMNEKQRNVVFEREMEKYVDAMAKHLNIHPSEARKRLKREINNGGGGSSGSSKLPDKLGGGGSESRESIFNNFTQGK